MTRTALYRHFDASGALLYVGISVDPLARHQNHVATAHWAGDIANVQVAWHDSREKAELAERAAIRSERPVHNRSHVAKGDGITVADILDAIGRKNLARVSGVGITAISNACVQNQMPARWYLVVRDMCIEVGQDCPDTLFHFVRPDQSGEV